MRNMIINEEKRNGSVVLTGKKHREAQESLAQMYAIERMERMYGA